nr:hypothetical protein [Tanacetum cinerariifolium]
MQNPRDISNPATALDMALELMAKAFQLNNTTQISNNQRSSSNPCYSQIAQSGMNIDQDRHMLIVDDNVGNQFRQNAMQNVGHLVWQNAVQNQAQAEANGNGINVNQIKCYNCQGVDHYASNCTVKPRKRDVAYLQNRCRLLKRKKQGFNSLLRNLISWLLHVLFDKALVYDSEGSTEVHLSKNYYNNDIFNMFTQEEHYTELLEPIPEPHQVQQNDSNVLYVVFSVEQGQSIQMMHMLSPKPDSFYHTKQKMALGYLNPFYLKQAQQKQQSLYNSKVLLEKHDPPVVYDLEETLQLAQESHLKMKQLNKEIKPENYTKINHLSGVFVSQKAKSREELYFSNTSKTANVSKPISIPNKEFSDDTTPSVTQKFLNEVKRTIVTLQHVIKQKITLDIHNWSSSVHQEIHKIIKDENFPIVNQVDARLQNFEIQFLKEAAKFVLGFKSLAKEADESLAKYKALELEITHVLRAVVSQDIMSIVQSNFVVDTLNLQAERDRTKERFENCIIKKENEYAKLWNDWRVNDRMMQLKKEKNNSSKAFDIGLVVTESNETESERHVLSSRSWNDTHTDDADINFVNGKQPMAEVQLSAEHNILANEQQNSEQFASVYDTYLLEKTYKDLSDSIKKRSVQTKDHADSLIVQLNYTPHYLPKVRESAPAKPHHVNAPKSSRISQKESYGSKDMAPNYYLEEAKKKTQDKNKNLKPREIPSAKTHHTPNAYTPKPSSNNQTSKNWPASKSCEETLKARQKADHSRNPSLFSNFKHFVCLTCQKCVFNANHDACITKFLKEVNSRAKIQPNNTRNSNKPVDSTSHTQKSGRKIVTGHSFSPNKSSVVHEKTKTPRSFLRWIPTGRTFNTAGLKWVPTGKTFTSSTTKVDCESPNAQEENEDFLNKLDKNIQKIIKEQVKEQVKAQVSKILPKIEKTVNEQLKAEVLTRSSNSSKTSHAKNLYKALVDAYECEKLILDTYGDTVTLKRCRDDEDKDEEPSAGSNRGSKRRRAEKEPESTSALKEKTSKTTCKSTEGSKSHHKSASESAPVKEPMHTIKDLKESAHQEFDTGATDDQPIAEASQHPDWFQKQVKPPILDRAWNKTLPTTHGPIQP